MLIKLKAAIQATGHLQWAVARSAGMKEGRLTRIITERAEPTPAEKKALAKVLKTSVRQLFGEG